MLQKEKGKTCKVVKGGANQEARKELKELVRRWSEKGKNKKQSRTGEGVGGKNQA